MVGHDFLLSSRRSFLGPHQPSWGDLLRLHDLRYLASVIRERISALATQPQSNHVLRLLMEERCHLEAISQEISQLEDLVALL